jgi:CelD/BcsL family acetyltransferase involved in cellulose biosynthesis
LLAEALNERAPIVRTESALGALAEQWDELALAAGSPFLTHAWLRAWWSAFGTGEPRWTVLLDERGTLLAGALLRRSGTRVSSAANVHSGDWDAVARDERSRAELWRTIAGTSANRVQVQGLPQASDGTAALREALARAGFRVAEVPGPFCPWLDLPETYDELLAGVSASLRSQIKRRRRGLEKLGEVTFRTVCGGATFDADLDTFLRLEASGWKGESGTAILGDAATERLYRGFARAAAERGWMRLYLLEVGGEAIAADYGCAFAGRGVFVKTGFDESHARLSPGLVLRAEVLRSSIEEGLHGYDFLGEADTYKTRWTPQVRPRTRLYAYRGLARPGYAYRRTLRPLLKSARDRVSARGAAGRHR